MHKFDVVIVAGRRPDLLDQTVRSFVGRLLRHFDPARVFVNLDPFGGDSAAHDRCREIILNSFPGATIFEPGVAGFGAAVQRLWAATSADLVLHLEDDWILERDIGPAEIRPLGQDRVMAMPFLSVEHDWAGPELRFRRKVRRRLFGVLSAGSVIRPVFGTSPRFLVGDFARQCAALMRPDLDPEKQMRADHNPQLSRYLRRFECEFIAGPGCTPVIRDTGRVWQEQMGVRKIVEGAVSRWEMGADLGG